MQRDLRVLLVMMEMDIVSASKTFLATSVKNVLRDFMDFQNVKVGFCLSIFLK